MNCSTFQSAALYPETVVRAGTWYTGRQLCLARRGNGPSVKTGPPFQDLPMTSLAIYRIDSISSVKLSILLVTVDVVQYLLVTQLLLLNDASDISVVAIRGE
jgi:hypothetical protein